MCLLGDGCVGLATIKRQATCGDSYKAGDHTQQGGLAGPIAAGDDQRLAGTETEIQTLEHAAPAPVAGQFIGSELHHGRRGPSGGQGPAAAGAGKRRYSEHFW